MVGVTDSARRTPVPALSPREVDTQQRYHAHEAAMATTTRRVATEDDLLAMPRDGDKYELVDGEIRVSPTGNRHSAVGVHLTARLVVFVKDRSLGHIMGADVGYRLPGGNVRSPDASFVASGRFPDNRPTVDWARLAPDLAVEILSPRDRTRPVLDKVGEYIDAGVRLVWVIDPERQRATVYRSLLDVREVGPDGDLDGEDVIPGFRCRLGELFE
jgi:Uma2 family endonuclease